MHQPSTEEVDLTEEQKTQSHDTNMTCLDILQPPGRVSKLSRLKKAWKEIVLRAPGSL
jgi:hypothetical protein